MGELERLPHRNGLIVEQMPSMSQLSMQLLGKDEMLPDDEKDAALAWRNYLISYISQKETEGVKMAFVRKCFLKRYVLFSRGLCLADSEEEHFRDRLSMKQRRRKVSRPHQASRCASACDPIAISLSLEAKTGLADEGSAPSSTLSPPRRHRPTLLPGWNASCLVFRQRLSPRRRQLQRRQSSRPVRSRPPWRYNLRRGVSRLCRPRDQSAGRLWICHRCNAPIIERANFCELY